MRKLMGCLGWILAVLVGAVVFMAFCGGVVYLGADGLSKAGKEFDRERAKAGSLTLANYDAIRPGMTVAEVSELLGSQGEPGAESQFGGLHTELRIWKSPFGPNCNVTFQNGKVVQKAQFGLR